MVDYRIERVEGAIVWKVDLKKLDKDMRVNVDDGLVALLCAGGNVVGEYRPGEKAIVNEGGRLAKQYKKSDFYFVVFNREKPSAVRWGVGKTPVTYEDRKLGGLSLGVRAYGHCDVIVHDAAKLWRKMPSEFTVDNRVEAKEIEDYMQGEIISRIAPILSRKLADIGDYTRIQGAMAELGTAIARELPDLEDLGLHISKTVVEGLDFVEESKEIIEKHRESKVAKIETDIAHERAEQIRSMRDAMGKIDEED